MSFDIVQIKITVSLMKSYYFRQVLPIQTGFVSYQSATSQGLYNIQAALVNICSWILQGFLFTTFNYNFN